MTVQQVRETEEYRNAVFQLFHWQYGHEPTNFHSLLYCLFRKADCNNRKRLNSAFLPEAVAMKDWDEAGDNGNDLFRKHGLLEK